MGPSIEGEAKEASHSQEDSLEARASEAYSDLNEDTDYR